ncbi:RBBP9/YdeN family alpha/beta hydrolase [Xenorhabdus sp. KK7.4]|uniref:RBBP9/YdeN family alpha/beta hydrolase n=1 Tax=Xenorhabdus sp. KK7.4 TaxID=1851572 RepID=UPI000C04C2BB|nr:alpha/beta fold hydrolase [Xenorhabdus sp. KK7.4]PHM51360.1 esterase [Xenorhabdus sp. KK7.4]
MFSGKKVIIIHGYTASPSSNWFPWLKEVLTEQGAEVIVPEMPESLSPTPEEWAKKLMEIAPNVDDNTIFIGHSLGCVALLRHLEAIKDSTDKIGGYILVSAFDSVQSTMPELASFTLQPLNYAFLCEVTAHRVSIISSNDEIVSPESSHALANSLQTEIINIENAGHFLDREGFIRLLPVYDALKAMVSA